jgi:hypothetical protein
MLPVIEVLMAAHDLPDVTIRRSLNQTVQDHETSRLIQASASRTSATWT